MHRKQTIKTKAAGTVRHVKECKLWNIFFPPCKWNKNLRSQRAKLEPLPEVQ